MLRDECVEVAPTWAQEVTTIGYREIDRQLRSIAKKRAGLDVEEARWLREAEKQRVWRKLGFSTALEYLEDVFGYAPRTAMERLRVAKDLGELPELEAEVRKGALPYSAAKELSRVMTRATERAGSHVRAARTCATSRSSSLDTRRAMPPMRRRTQT